jgi:hypothetical protein
MPHSIEKLREAVLKLHSCEDATWVSAVPVREEWKGKVAWEGVVHVFEVKGHNRAKRIYVWDYQDDEGKSRYTTVLELPPVTDAKSAVKVAIASLARRTKTRTVSP